jgi:hypothetical protein
MAISRTAKSQRRMHRLFRLTHLLTVLISLFLLSMQSRIFPPESQSEVFVSSTSSPDWMFYIQASLFESQAMEFDRYMVTTRFPPGVTFPYTFVGLFDENTTSPPNLAIPRDYVNWSNYAPELERWPIRTAAGQFYAFEYALRETNARWIGRLFSDTVINFDRLLPYMRELDRRYDPLTDVVLRGDCVAPGFPYLQGGSGYILSRRALEVLVPYARYSIWGFWEDHDDQRLGHVMGRLRIHAYPCGSSAFIGIRVRDEDWERITQGNWAGMITCPMQMVMGKPCPRFVAPVSQIVFHHAGRVPEWDTIGYRGMMALLRNLWAQPHVGFWRTGREKTVLCEWNRTPIAAGTFIFA